MDLEAKTMRLPIRWLWTAAAGLAATLIGLAWDAVMHTRDHELASHEGVFTLSNPSHALFVAGLAVTALGVAAALGTMLGRPKRLRLPTAAAVVVVVLVAGGLGAWAAVSTDEHAHEATAQLNEGDEGDMPERPHGSDKADATSATAEQRVAAQELLDDTIAAIAAYRDTSAAEDAGYRFGMVEMEVKLVYHVPNPLYRRDGAVLNPRRPETLLYARHPENDSLVLVGVVFRMEETGVPGPAIGGPITVWHNHSHCIDPATQSEVAKPTAGVCAEGTELHNGPDMMHVWFTDDVATAFNGQRPPVQDLIAHWAKLRRAAFCPAGSPSCPER